MRPVTIVGAGLAGSEAAWQVARFGVPVRLIDMKPQKKTPAHHLDTFAELVCSNSLKAMRLQSASGLLKEELRRMGSMLLDAADTSALPAGGALAVDRDVFSSTVTENILSHPLIRIESAEITSIPTEETVIMASGPLTDGALFEAIQKDLGLSTLHFYDAAAPIVTLESVDESIAFRQSRYDRGGSDYLNCPMDEPTYRRFIEALVQAETAEVMDFDQEAVFEGCMPIETMAKRGPDTLRFGPLKPVGLTDPNTGRRPYACVQLRQDNLAGSLYNLVGFQTRLKFEEQKRVFRMIPGLAHAEFARFGVMHRNTFLDSPRVLNADFSVDARPGLFFAGQITGVEGYVESMASGLLAGIFAALSVRGFALKDRLALVPDDVTITGALARYVSNPQVRHFQPMNANFGLLPDLSVPVRQKEARYQAFAERSIAALEPIVRQLSAYEKTTGT